MERCGSQKIEVLNIKFNCLLLFSSWCKIDYIKDSDPAVGVVNIPALNNYCSNQLNASTL